MTAYALSLVFSLLVLVVIFLRLRNSHMQERYATWWLVIAVVLLLVSIFPGLLKWISNLFGVVVPLNLAFFLAGVVILLMSLQFSVDLSRAAEKRRRLAEEIALLGAEFEDVRVRLSELESATGGRRGAGEDHDDGEGAEPNKA